MKKNKILALDVETGGLDPFLNPILQFAGIVLDPISFDPIDSVQMNVAPYKDLDVEDQVFTKVLIPKEEIYNGMQLKEFYGELKTFMEDHFIEGKKDWNRLVVLGHNVQFDMSFLDRAFYYNDDNIYNYVFPNLIDTYVLGKIFLREESTMLNLSSMCDRYGIVLENAHDAMADTVATVKLFKKIIEEVPVRANFNF